MRLPDPELTRLLQGFALLLHSGIGPADSAFLLAREGMISMDQAIAALCREGKISRETALHYADQPEQMKRLIQ